MTDRAAPSNDAIALLRGEAAQLDVEDLVDLCYARASDRLRTSVYLEALRGRAGEQAQVAACLLCFDLARGGDERRESELHFLLPTLDHLFEAEERGSSRVVAVLIEKSPVVAELWQGLVEQAAQRDPRAMNMLPEVDTTPVIELDLFDDEEFAALEIDLEQIEVDLDVDDEAYRAFDEGLAPLVPQYPGALFSAIDSHDLERLERLRDHCKSFSASVPVAAEMHTMTLLFLATHTRALGLFGRRNKTRDRALIDGVTALLSLPEPPAQVAGWFATSDVPGAEAHAWLKLAELLIDVASFVGGSGRNDLGAQGNNSSWAATIAAAYAADNRSSRIPPLLAVPGERRRRR